MNSARLGNAVRIVIAPDTFEGSLSAGEAARCLSTGIREARADAEVAVVPMADGGEGTLDAARVNGYERRAAVVHGRLGAPLRASFAVSWQAGIGSFHGPRWVQRAGPTDPTRLNVGRVSSLTSKQLPSGATPSEKRKVAGSMSNYVDKLDVC
jgi:Glycerate kinase family